MTIRIPAGLILLMLFSGFSFSVSLQAQQKVNPGESLAATRPVDSKRGPNGARIMFYNVENLFDVVDDSLTKDDEYTPAGIRHWNYSRLQKKINNISKSIIRVGGWEPPEIIGLCEVENRYVLSNLAMDSPLKNIGYRIIHRNSPDPRGIDVAMLYRPEKFKPLDTRYIGIRYPFDPVSRTRDILYVKGLLFQSDTIHLFVNHWPSRFGGYKATIEKRKYVASVVRHTVDSILAAVPSAHILIMGDFNDEPTDESISQVLKAKMDSVNLAPNDLYNMMTGAGCSWNHGSIKDKELWITIDQFIVSAGMVLEKNGLCTTFHSARIMDAPFLLQEDDAWFGMKPFRTYYGPKYLGGFSDHLPIYMDIFKCTTP